jgi:hypothetical protein
MEEIIALRSHLERGRYKEALHIAIDLEDMARDDKITRIGSFAEILLLHLIKQAAERRTTRSWQTSMDNAVLQIAAVNKRRKAGGFYLSDDDLRETLEEVFRRALNGAALEAFEGKYEANELAALIDKPALLQRALELVLEAQLEAQNAQ